MCVCACARVIFLPVSVYCHIAHSTVAWFLVVATQVHGQGGSLHDDRSIRTFALHMRSSCEDSKLLSHAVVSGPDPSFSMVDCGWLSWLQGSNTKKLSVSVLWQMATNQMLIQYQAVCCHLYNICVLQKVPLIYEIYSPRESRSRWQHKQFQIHYNYCKKHTIYKSNIKEKRQVGHTCNKLKAFHLSIAIWFRISGNNHFLHHNFKFPWKSIRTTVIMICWNLYQISFLTSWEDLYDM